MTVYNKYELRLTTCDEISSDFICFSVSAEFAPLLENSTTFTGIPCTNKNVHNQVDEAINYLVNKNKILFKHHGIIHYGEQKFHVVSMTVFLHQSQLKGWEGFYKYFGQDDTKQFDFSDNGRRYIVEPEYYNLEPLPVRKKVLDPWSKGPEGQTQGYLDGHSGLEFL